MSVVHNSSKTHLDQTPRNSKRKSDLAEISNLDDENVKCMKPTVDEADFSWSVVPVLSDQYHEKIQIAQVFVAKIVNKKETSRLLKEICSRWPLPQMHHLKRVRRIGSHAPFDIILRAVNPDEKVSMKEISLGDVIGDSTFCTEGLAGPVTIQIVPKCQPLTSSQYKESKLLWPVQYRENKYIECILNDKVFSEIQKQNMRKYMTTAVDVAKHGKMQVGAVVVDPASEKVIAIAYDRRHVHPLQHAVMVAIDLVAKSQGGGAWHYNDDPFLYNVPCSKDSELMDQTNCDDTKKLSLPYICTNYDLYVTREPCVMCSMALVHSRIHRVFYGVEMLYSGLGSRYKIHVQPGLNHHYEVWKGLLKEQCTKLRTDDYSCANADSYPS